MKNPFTHLLLALCMALLAGCSASSSGAGSAQVAVLPPHSGASAISRVSVTASAADMPSVGVDLAPSSSGQRGLLSNIPSGAHRSFLAQAFDASGTLLFQGSASGVSIAAGQSSLIALTLQERNAPPASLNEPPVIDSLVASSTFVPTGGTLSLEVTAHGLHPGDALSYAWSSTEGSFSSASSASTSWTAPASPGTQTLTITVTDSDGLSASASLDIDVLASGNEGAARFTLSFNSFPRVDALHATVSQLATGQPTSVSASASDLDGDSLSYSWAASCSGAWTNASSSSAQFTPDALPGGNCNNCNLTVTVSDGRGGQNTGTLALCVSTTPAPTRFSPLVILSYSSYLPGDFISPGQVLTYEVAASDPQGSALTFSWSATSGAMGTAAGTATQSRTTWTAPSCVSRGTTPAITATVTNAFTLTATASFTVLGLPSCSTSAWATAGTLGSPRYNHTATLLPGDKVLISGGQNTSGSLATAEVYGPGTPPWNATNPMAQARHFHAATPLLNGDVLVSGGLKSASGSSTYLAETEVYNPATGRWSTTGPMGTPRYVHTATRLQNGKVLVAGGYNNVSTYLATAELYDPATGRWSTTGSMASPRGFHTATLLADGKVLVSGGRASGLSNYYQTAELYDPATGRWSLTGAMAAARANHTATVLSNGKVLVSGGLYRTSFLETAEVYDPSLGTWSTTGPMATRRANFAATALPGGRVLVSGGQNTTGYLAAAEVYNPGSGTWSAVSALPSARGHHTATLSSGKVLVSGGYGNGPLSVAELYTP
ncbi:MAG TPA: kelch repeat-containing protein [Myxococcaceae bacterium]